MKVAVIQYNAGNIQSVSFALQRLGIEHVITDEVEEIKKADKVIFPGVGEASSTMAFLKDRKLDILIKDLQQPVLGICLGMQLLCSYSEENNTPCLGIFEDSVRLFKAEGIKVPHMGWNSLHTLSGWLDASLNQRFVYFVHSYFVPLSAYATALCNYGETFTAAMKKNNFFAVQFHPEKSASVGEEVLLRFLNR